MGLLDQVLGAALGSSSARGGSSQIMSVLMALLAQRGGATGAGGGLGGMLQGLTGGLGEGLGGGGGLGDGGMGGGGMGGEPATGVGGLGGPLDRLTQNGHGEIANSWVGSGPNRPIAPNQLEEALGRGTIEDLSRQTGLPGQDLLQQLSEHLPGVVDRLTPHGRMPEASEMAHW